jgi:type IV pilus assembly protein PilB
MKEQLTISDDRLVARQLAERYRCEFVELSGTDLDLDLFRSIQAELMFRYNFVPLRMEGEALVVAMADPSDLVLIDEVSALLGRDLVIRVAPQSEIQDLLKKSESSQRMLEEATEGFKLQLIRENESGDETITIEKITQEESSPIIRLVDTIIFTALERRASDIHIETRDTEVGVKYRIDGALTESDGADRKRAPFDDPFAYQDHVGARHLRTPRSPGRPIQDPIQGGRSIDFRVSIMPSDPWRRCGDPYSRQGNDQRKISDAEPGRCGLCGK